MDYSTQSYLAHYGVPGMKWGIRRFVDAAGRLTQAGLARMQQERRSQKSGSSYNIRKKIPGSVHDLIKSSPKKQTKSEQERNKERTKKIIAAAGAVALTGVAVYAIHRRNKVDQNLMQLAKNKIHDDYDQIAKSSNLKGQDLVNNRYWKAHDMSKIYDRHTAKEVLGLKNGRQTRAFIKGNNLAKVKTADIIERRMDGPLVKGYRRNFAGNMVELSGRHLRKARDRAARNLYV